MKIFDIKTPTYSKRYHIFTLGSIQKRKGMTLTSGYREPDPQDMCVCEPSWKVHWQEIQFPTSPLKTDPLLQQFS